MATASLPQLAIAAVVTAACTSTFAAPSSSDSPPDAVFDWPAGVACDFALRVELRGGRLTTKDFFDRNGNPVRFFIGGQNSAQVFINVATGASIEFKPSGVTQQVTFNPDGTTNFVSTGHVGMTLFPTDNPAGPSTVMYIGRLVTLLDSSGVVTTVQSFTGQKIDICAALS